MKQEIDTKRQAEWARQHTLSSEERRKLIQAKLDRALQFRLQCKKRETGLHTSR